MDDLSHNAEQLPNLLIIGAAKCGTTSLHSYLDCHPDISMASPRESGPLVDNDVGGKEMRFFWRDDWRDRLDWYRSHFTGMTTQIRGEATPAYSAHPFHAGVAERIHATVPHAQLLYLVRDPIERICSHYVQQRADGDRRPFEQRMAEWSDPDNSIVCPSRYATQVEQYLGYFSPSQLLVVDQSELGQHRRTTLQRIFAFLGVDRGFWSPALEEELNTRQDKRMLTPKGARLFNGWIDPGARRLMGGRWAQLRPYVRRALSEQVAERPAVAGELRERLIDLLQPEVDRLRELTGERFASWSL
jgi:hypothetical protein